MKTLVDVIKLLISNKKFVKDVLFLIVAIMLLYLFYFAGNKGVSTQAMYVVLAATTYWMMFEIKG